MMEGDRVSVILAFPAVYNVFVIFSNEYFESDDQDGGMISLSALLRSFSAPVTEEHAWALIYQVTLEKGSHLSL